MENRFNRLSIGVKLMSLSETNVEEILSYQPDDPELGHILDNISELYGAYLVETDKDNQDYYMELIDQEIGHYRKVIGMEKESAEYDF
jgi:hypothetical protein